MSVACVTGASSGIGKAFARQLYSEGWSLVLVARSEEKLNALAEELTGGASAAADGATAPTADVFPCDLSREDECLRLCKQLETIPDLRLLINNAGIGGVGRHDEMDRGRQLQMIRLNVEAVEILCREIIPHMEKTGGGQVLNVASSAGLLKGGPYMATYYATKAYVVSLTSSIYTELKERRSTVAISALCPGPVDTNFNGSAGVRSSLPGISPEYCARFALRKLNRKKLIIVPGPQRWGMPFYNILPRRLQLRITGAGQKSKMR